MIRRPRWEIQSARIRPGTNTAICRRCCLRKRTCRRRRRAHPHLPGRMPRRLFAPLGLHEPLPNHRRERQSRKYPPGRPRPHPFAQALRLGRITQIMRGAPFEENLRSRLRRGRNRHGCSDLYRRPHPQLAYPHGLSPRRHRTQGLGKRHRLAPGTLNLAPKMIPRQSSRPGGRGRRHRGLSPPSSCWVQPRVASG
jgi:hypothetical protein